MSNYIILSEKKWHLELYSKLKNDFPNDNWILISQKEDFNKSFLDSFLPNKIFIPHWSYIIPAEIYEGFDCIVFHMTDLPYGRGGSPLQNLIVRGHKDTKISALKVEKGIDTGDIYIKSDLLLHGTATEIFARSTNVIHSMIESIITKGLQPYAQEGVPVIFKRRTKDMSNIQDLQNMEEVYDYIRMLDAEGYPNAFLETPFFKFEFTQASILEADIINAHVRITKK